MKAPFLCEEKHLTWANGQIPEFFWQVYDNPEATDFSAYHEVLGPDAINMVKIREEPITVYEKKIHEELTTVDEFLGMIIQSLNILFDLQFHISVTQINYLFWCWHEFSLW